MFGIELIALEQFGAEQSDAAGSMLLAYCFVKTKE